MSTPLREEADLLGSMTLDNRHYYGIHTLRALDNFQISRQQMSDIPAFISALVVTKKAAAQANRTLGTLDPERAGMIIAACDLMQTTQRCYDQFPIDLFQGGAGTSVNMNCNEVIANLALELAGHPKGAYDILNPNDHVNRCQSTNDVYPTAFRVALFDSTFQLLRELKQLIKALEDKAVSFKAVLKMGRTQLQDAVPMTLGQEFHAFAVTLHEEIKSISHCQQLLLEVNLGATAIGTGMNTPPDYSSLAIRYLAELTGHAFVPAEDLIEATSDCGAYLMLHSAYKRLAMKLSKICNDLRLLSSGPRAGLGEINLPRRQAGSSIMPAKVNPVIPEVVNQIAFKVMGNDVTVTMAAEAGQLQLNVMEPVIAQCLFESLSLLSNGCRTLREKCIEGISANQAQCEHYVFSSIGLVTFLTPYIGHHACDEIGQLCAQSGQTVRDAVLARGLLSAAQLDEIFSVDNLRHPRYPQANRAPLATPATTA